MLVAYLEPIPADVEAIIRSCLPDGLELRVRRPEEPPEEAVREAEFILVATTRITAELLAAAPRLKLIQHQGVGYNNIDVAAAARAGVPVALTPEGTTVPVAEHVFLLILSLYRRLFAARDSLREGRWLQWELRPGSCGLAGKRIGLVGFGRIGQAVAKRARAFDCPVLYADPVRAPAAVEAELEARYRPLDDLLAEADVVSLHLPLAPGTEGLIGARELALMQPPALLINTARGGLVDEEALYRALAGGRLAGAGLDVFAQEPPPPDHPLLRLENVVATPHVAAGTRDALAAKMNAAFGNMLRVARGEPPRNAVQ
jgi:phosphoglycerate dehydrogenase-like enzyme